MGRRPDGLSKRWSSNVCGYNVYRGTHAGGPCNRINSSLIAAAAYTDTAVQAGQTYFYVSTVVDSSGVESAFSNETMSTVPTP
jgi:fibronectin type 3 domain-containing protein